MADNEVCLSPETLAALQAFRAQAESNSQPQLQLQSDSQNGGNDSTKESVFSNMMDNALYKKKEYWDERFQSEESYDWLLTYQHIKPSIIHFLRPEHRILIVGCGNSTFSADLYDDGFQNIVNIDFSKIVIDRMKEANALRSNMTWMEMDMCDLSTFDASSFNIVIDKAAMDALLVDEGSVWDPEPSIISSVDKMCREVSRVLTPQGIFLQISFSQPHFRTKYLMGQHVENTVTNPYSSVQGFSNLYQWTLSTTKIELEAGCLETFLFTMIK